MKYIVRTHTNSQTTITGLAKLGGTMETSRNSNVYSARRKMLNTVKLAYFMFRESIEFWLDSRDHLSFWESVNAGWYQMYEL